MRSREAHDRLAYRRLASDPAAILPVLVSHYPKPADMICGGVVTRYQGRHSRDQGVSPAKGSIEGDSGGLSASSKYVMYSNTAESEIRQRTLVSGQSNQSQRAPEASTQPGS